MRYWAALVLAFALGAAGCGGEGSSDGVLECQNAEDCNDSNECTEDSCSETGRCEYEPASDGTWCCHSWAWTGITYCCVDDGLCTDGACR